MGSTVARERLLDAAERLFAAHGLAGASLRSINAEAGLSPAALHYHFGTREALVEAILERRMSELMERRRELLDSLEERGDGSPRDVIDALIRPLTELLAREGEGGRRYVRLLCRLQADGDLDPRFVLGRYREGVERLEPLLQRALPHQPVHIVRLRLALATDLMLRSLADWENLATLWSAGEPALSLDELVTALLDFLAGGLESACDTTPSAGDASRTRARPTPYGVGLQGEDA